MDILKTSSDEFIENCSDTE